MNYWPAKDPAEVLDYGIDWKKELGTATITGSSWAVPDGVAVVEESHGADFSVIRLSGGTLAERYKLTNTVTASDGEVHVLSGILRIEAQ